MYMKDHSDTKKHDHKNVTEFKSFIEPILPKHIKDHSETKKQDSKIVTELNIYALPIFPKYKKFVTSRQISYCCKTSLGFRYKLYGDSIWENNQFKHPSKEYLVNLRIYDGQPNKDGIHVSTIRNSFQEIANIQERKRYEKHRQATMNLEP